MDVVHPRCGGIDVHNKTAVACVIVSEAEGPPHQEIRTYGTMTADLLALADWLAAERVTHVAMEATGGYWEAPFGLLEGVVEQVLVVNARTSSRCLGARPTSRMPSGSPTCCGMGCSRRAASRIGRSGSSVT